MNISTEKINDFLQQADIEGLLQAGAPADEYFSEAQIIAQALVELEESYPSIKEVEAILIHVWMTSFDLSGSDINARKSAIHSLAEQIVKFFKSV